MLFVYVIDDQIRSALGGKDKATLLNFIKEKGMQRKQEMLEAARFQTQDYAQTAEAKTCMEAELARLQEEQQEYAGEATAQREAFTKESSNIANLQTSLRAKEAALAREQESGEKSDTFVESCVEAVPQVTKKMVTQCNKILENHSPPQLVALLEHFVALMRNKSGTKPVDVELYLKDDAKLRAQMSKTSTTSCSLEIVNKAAEVIDSIADQFGPPQVAEDIDCSPFFCILDWSMNFCKAAKIDLRLSGLEKEVSDAKADLDRAELSINRFNEQFADAQRFNFEGYYGDMIGTMQERVELMTNINAEDEKQAQIMQEKHHTFDKRYLADYVAKTQGQ